jgi:hypothetical protein
MSTETQTSLAERYALTPGVGVGRIRFGDRVTDHADLNLRIPEPDWLSRHEEPEGLPRPEVPAGAEAPEEADEVDYAEYAVASLEETLIVYVDGDGCVESVSFYEFCLVDGRDLIGMGVGQLLLVLGVPSAIEAEEIGRDVELLYAYDELGLTIWTVDGEVCVVQAGRADSL